MITSKTISDGILRALATIVIVALILYFLFQIQVVIIYLVVALILTLIGNPILNFFKRRLKFNNLFGTIATLFIFILIIAGFIMMFVPLISSQSQSLSLLNTTEIEKNITQLTNQITAFLDYHNIDSAQMLKEANISSKVNFNFIPNFLNSILGTISSFGMGLASVLFITFFFLKDRVMFIVGAKKILPDSQEDKILNSLEKINILLSRYFIGLLLQLSIVFVLYLVVLLIFGIENALIIAFLCAILNIIPYIGPLIGSVLAAVLTMISNLGSDFQTEILPLTIYILIGFWIVQVIDNNVSQPLIFSSSVNSHPLEIFLVILIAGFMSGILGMILAVPIYTILKVVGKEFFPENKVIKILTKNI
ncbi:putative PurR-regulated permease PerM [Flavobacterium arsenatis]|uniref:PurR-regulated permease PerM n=1 Tax=Flavobacterium arsenatis TaxID=1484332 RepID=A0ABU1TMG7_9FLAO|nr:AI-2E family transporter [Flavobacterium arsenatis]MDR6967154.1 putative PurR-regulated permease PerM [Flavobacterium arsenatis]